jgi:hypothetical protein
MPHSPRWYQGRFWFLESGWHFDGIKTNALVFLGTYSPAQGIDMDNAYAIR